MTKKVTLQYLGLPFLYHINIIQNGRFEMFFHHHQHTTVNTYTCAFFYRNDYTINVIGEVSKETVQFTCSL